MRERSELSVGCRAEPDVLASFSSIGGNGESLIAGRYELDRAVEPFRGQGDPGCTGIGSLRAERAADVARNRSHPVWIDVELLGNPILGAPHELRRFIDGQLRAIPRAGRGKQFDRIVMLS